MPWGARRFTMPRFLTHEPVASDLFNASFNSATGTLQSWSRFLGNTDQLLGLLIKRLEVDWTSLSPKMRRPWNGKDVETSIGLVFCT